MAEIIVKTVIKGGPGKVVITRHGFPDIDIDQTGSQTMQFEEGDHYLMVLGVPSNDGSIEVSFHQGDENLASHTYKSAASIMFKLEVK